MVRTRRQTAAVRGVLIGSALEHPTLWDYVGKSKYLQMAVSKAVARAYVAKFGAVTAKDLSGVAAYDGSLSLLLWSIEIGCNYDKDVFLDAVEGGQSAIVQFLFDNDCPLPGGSEAFGLAAEAGDLHTFELLHQHKFEWDADTCGVTAYAGWLDGLQWLRAHACPWDVTARYLSAQEGRLEVYKWAHYNGCEGSHKDAAYAAVTTNQMEILKWMLDDGYTFDNPEVCACAAYTNQLSVLQWLRSNNAAWDGRTLRFAREKGHLDIETWAKENGCPEEEPEVEPVGLGFDDEAEGDIEENDA